MKHRSYDYKVGDKILKKIFKPTKLGKRTIGPYKIIQVYTNGNVTVELNKYWYEQLNIRRIIPFRT